MKLIQTCDGRPRLERSQPGESFDVAGPVRLDLHTFYFF